MAEKKVGARRKSIGTNQVPPETRAKIEEKLEKRAQKKTIGVLSPPPGPVVAGSGYGGRYTRYNEEVHAKIVEAVRNNASRTDAGLMAGLGKDTIHDWIYSARHNGEKFPHLVQLLRDIETAESERNGEIAEMIYQTAMSRAPGTWQAGAWILERRDPGEWGRKDKLEHVNAGPKQQINQVILVDSGAREAARDLLKRVAGNSSPDITIGPGGSVQLEAGGDS